MKDWLRDCLVDPVERQPLFFAGDRLVARNGANYPIVEGIPVLLRADLAATHRGAMRTVKLADMARQGLPIDLIAAVNLREELKAQIRREIAAGSDAAEAVIRRLVPLSNGFGYRDLAPGDAIPIPQFFARGGSESLLDIGSSWGRWTIAAARAGFRAVGLDPMLGPLMAAKRFAANKVSTSITSAAMPVACRLPTARSIARFPTAPCNTFPIGLCSDARRNCPRACT